MDNAVLFETSEFRHCVRKGLKASINIIDVWATGSEDEMADDPGAPPNPEPGSHVIAYGMFGKFFEFESFANRRHIVAKQLTKTLAAVSKEIVQQDLYAVELKIPIEITLTRANQCNQLDQDMVNLTALAPQWERKVEPALRREIRENKKGCSIKGTIQITPAAGSTMERCSCSVMDFILKDKAPPEPVADAQAQGDELTDEPSISKDALNRYIMELLTDDRMSWKKKELEIMKPNIFIDFEKTKTFYGEANECGMHFVDITSIRYSN